MRPKKVDDRLKEKLPALWMNPEITTLEIGERFGVSSTTITNVASQLQLGERPKRVRMVRHKHRRPLTVV